MATHPTHARRPTREEAQRALSPLDFPLDKEALVACVADQGDDASIAVVDQLKALPLASYGSADEVLQSIELADQQGR